MLGTEPIAASAPDPGKAGVSGLGFAGYIGGGIWGCKHRTNVKGTLVKARDSSSTGVAAPLVLPEGARLHAGLLDPQAQAALVSEIRAVVRAAPLRRQKTPGGREMSVRTTACGDVGWHSGRDGYGYVRRQPDGSPWPPMPSRLADLWRELCPGAAPPDSCLVNYYDAAARLGLHQDRDEADLSQPVLSVSLGDAALFRLGGTVRGGPTRGFWLQSGDVLVLAGPARMAFHGIDRIRFGSSRLLPKGGRINLTLRVALTPAG